MTWLPHDDCVKPADDPASNWHLGEYEVHYNQWAAVALEPTDSDAVSYWGYRIFSPDSRHASDGKLDIVFQPDNKARQEAPVALALLAVAKQAYASAS